MHIENMLTHVCHDGCQHDLYLSDPDGLDKVSSMSCDSGDDTFLAPIR